MSLQTWVPALIGVLTFLPSASAQTAADSGAIRQVALDYIQGWYTGDAERMERALYPEVVKRVVISVAGRESVVQDMTAQQLVQGTAMGAGKQASPSDRRHDVTILDVYGGAASVKIVTEEWIDYLHIGKIDDRWLIINVLWELTPEGRRRYIGGGR